MKGQGEAEIFNRHLFAPKLKLEDKVVLRQRQLTFSFMDKELFPHLSQVPVQSSVWDM